MKVLVTGAAGFIGSTLSHRLLDRGDRVIGIDNVNDYYSVKLKEDRLARLTSREGSNSRRSTSPITRRSIVRSSLMTSTASSTSARRRASVIRSSSPARTCRPTWSGTST